MINVAICDDVIATTGKIETMLQNIANKEFYTNRYGCLLGRRTFGCFSRNGEFF